MDRDASRPRRAGLTPERAVARQHVVKSQRNAVSDSLADVVQHTLIRMGATERRPNDSPATNTPGRELAFARTRLSLSLEEISRRTKIGMPYLLAIENDDVKKLPGNFYARAFLRAYAREVHCDPEEVVKRFGIPAEEPTPIELQHLGEALHLHTPVELDDRRTARRIQMVALGALVAGSFYVASGKPLHLMMPRLATVKPAAVPAAPETPSSVTTPAAVPTSGAAPAATTAPEAANPLAAPINIEVNSRQECWLTAMSDGQRVTYRLLAAGETTHIEGHKEIVLRFGDAGAVAFTINGAAGKPLGDAGQAVTIHVTPDNYREFLSSPPSTDRSSAGT